MPTESPNLVATGLDLAPTADPKPVAPAEPTPTQAAPVEPVQEASPPQSEPSASEQQDKAEKLAIIRQAEMEARASVAPDPVRSPSGEDARAAYTRLKAEQEERDRREDEARKAAFTKAVLEARKPQQTEHKPQPVAPGIQAQTAREMAEGARQNQRHAEFHAVHPMPRGHNPEPGSSTPVFRPEDYVPNFEQGNVKVGGIN